MRTLGIDLGTTFTKAAIFDSDANNGKPTRVALNSNAIDFGFGATRYAMPTVVSMANGSFYVGNQALNNKLVCDAYFDNFKIVLERNDEYASKELEITFHTLISKIFEHIRKSLVCGGSEKQKNTNLHIDKIIFTVPVSTVPYGNRWNRMINAAKEVFPDVKSIEIIPEPVAAGFALLGERIHSDKRINGRYFAIYDLGGGTFDATILKVENEQIFVVGKSVGSDDEQRWGGIYIDDLIRREYIKNGSMIRHAIESANSLSLKERFNLESSLRTEPTKAKIELSEHDIYEFVRGDFSITRKRFEELCSNMISDTIKCTRNLLKTKENEGFELSLKDIDTVFLVGGSSRIPMITKCWEEERTIGDNNKETVNYGFKLSKCDIEIVATGAALYPILKVAPEHLIKYGVRYLKKKCYSQAALCFQNAENALGNYLLGTLYYTGTLGHKRKYREAIRLFKESNTPLANTVLAIMAFQGGQGMPRNHAIAKDYLALAGTSEITKALSNALNSNNCSAENLDKIYGYDPLSSFIDSFEDEEDWDEEESLTDRKELVSEREVAPVEPELDILKILSNGGYQL